MDCVALFFFFFFFFFPKIHPTSPDLHQAKEVERRGQGQVRIHETGNKEAGDGNGRMSTDCTFTLREFRTVRWHGGSESRHDDDHDDAVRCDVEQRNVIGTDTDGLLSATSDSDWLNFHSQAAGLGAQATA